MKKVLLIVLVMALVIGLVPMSIAMAAKPQKAIEMSNGMPSGDHETLLIHGKKVDYQCVECEPCATCEPPVQCNVINMPEYGTATIKYVSGKKVKIDELTVFDSCAGWEGNDPPVDDPAEVWLPYEQEGYYVFFRALGKPGKGDEERYIIFENESLEAYPLLNDVSSPDEVMLGLGMITQQGIFKKDASGELYRFDGDGDKGKGKSQGIDMTDMFLWSGLVFHPDLDVNMDGVVNEMDVIADNCTGDINHDGTVNQTEIDAWAAGHLDPDDVALPLDGVVDAKDVVADTCDYDTNGDGVISYDGDYDELTFPDCEFEVWLQDNQGDPENPLWYYYDEAWVFTIADLVYLNQTVTNEGIKNLQIRFYPVATTEFSPAPVE
ncbi:MAG: hypothetical protein JSU79_05345 [Dehalococcoidales bacterium]|nr:MAG: hypothetical protein JSU79_05345 [Dehalococcoidales bacterium]